MRTRALPAALGVFVLVAAVAIAAAGSTPTGSSASRAPDPVLDTILTFVLIAAIPALVLYLYGVLYANKLSSVRGTLGSVLHFAVFLLIVIGAVYVWVGNWNRGALREETPPEQGFAGSPRGTELPTASESTYDPEVVWIPVLVIFGLAAVAVVAYVASVWRAREGLRRHRKTVAEAMATALDESLDDLLAEADARRAVIAAYARLERVLAAHGLRRHASETPDELLVRTLPVLDVDRRSIRRLTDLFTWAKFSHHDVDADMKEEAIAALVQVRDELREAAEEAERVRIRSLRAGGSPA